MSFHEILQIFFWPKEFFDATTKQPIEDDVLIERTDKLEMAPGL